MILKIKESLDDTKFVGNSDSDIVQEGVINVCRNDTCFQIKQVTHFKFRGDNIFFDSVTNYPQWAQCEEHKYEDYESKFCICSLKQVPNVANTSLALGDKRRIRFEAGVPSAEDGSYEHRNIHATYTVTDQFIMIK